MIPRDPRSTPPRRLRGIVLDPTPLRLDRDYRLLWTGTLVSANAGHPPLLVLRAGGEVELVEGRGPVLGVLGDVLFEDAEIVLEPGDAIIAYTDGVLDAGAPDRLRPHR